MLAGFVIDLAYIGANGISREHGLTTPDPAVSEVKAQAIRAARRTVFAGVHTKFGAVSFCRFAEIGALETIVTSTAAPVGRGPPLLPAGPAGHPRLTLVQPRLHPRLSPARHRPDVPRTPLIHPRMSRSDSCEPRADGRPPRATLAMAAAGTLLAPLLSGCWAGAGGAGSGGNSINVLMVNNPQMVELQKLTAAHFTKETGIKVNFTVLPENDVRDKISQDFANQAGPVRRRRPSATTRSRSTPRTAGCTRWTRTSPKDPAYDEQDILDARCGSP